jgi:hypothetical protein
MMSHGHGTGRLRRAGALATWVGLPASIPLLMIAACAASDETYRPDAPGHDVVPATDAGDDGSLDSAVDGDAAVVPCTLDNLCSVPSPLKLGAIAAMTGRSKNDVWASGTGGLIMHWTGQQWAALDSSPDAGRIDETLSSIFLTPDEMWGVSGTLILRRGLDPNSVRSARVTIFGSLFRSLSGIGVLSNGDAYMSIAPGFKGMSDNYLAKLDFDNAQIAYEPESIHPTTNEPQSSLGIRALFLTPEKALWLVGEHAVVVRYPVLPAEDEGAPLLGQGLVVPVSSQANLLAAWGYGEHLWAAGTNGTILHFDGAAWHAEDTGTAVTLNAIFGFSPKDLWAAGDSGTVLHFDGEKWSSIGFGGPVYEGSLKAIWGSGPDDVWIGGEGGMFHWGALP